MSNSIIYFILPCYNEEEAIATTAGKLGEKIEQLIRKEKIDRKSCMVFVDDGSTDGTWEIITRLHKEKPDRIKGISFSANRGHQIAVLAGYHYACDKCDAAISLDADLQHDIEAIDEFIEKFETGNQIVYGVRTTRKTDGFFKKWSAGFFYQLMAKLGCMTIPNHADYRLVSNTVMRELRKYREQSIFLRGIFPSMGFRHDYVHFEVHERVAGKSKYNLSKMLRLATDGITAFSSKPLDVFWVEAVVLFLFAIVFGVLAAVFRSGIIIMAFLGFLFTDIIVFNLAIMALYIGKINFEVKQRPQYIVKEILDVDN